MNTAEEREVHIPHEFTPRSYQEAAFDAIRGGIKRLVLLWHRRAGKEKTSLNIMIEQMFRRTGSYYYFFPTYAQGKKILWQGMDASGFKFMDHFPPEVIKSKNEAELKIELVNGSIFQIVGTDNYDSVVGTNPIGMVLSEYALQDPQAWALFRPILRENGGWAIFDFTPRGKNHAHELSKMAENNPDWFFQKLTVDDTKRPNGTPVITPEDIDAEHREGMSDELIQQEYYCSFEGSIEGSYYAKLMTLAEKDGRITNVPYDAAVSVDTIWDLGVGDSTAIWFVQRVGKAVQLIDYYEQNGEGFSHYKNYLDDLRNERNYTYGTHFMPHDINARDLSGEGKTRKAIAEGLGIQPIQVVPKLSIEDGIEAVRAILSSCYFDKTRCARGVDALNSYHKEYDEKNKVFKKKPHHDWSSHGADSFRYLAVGYKEQMKANTTEPLPVIPHGGSMMG
ncbi:MAG: hypothetical protein KAS32_25060 [Candidatus Peribacteraceae bacterium]|nr:hypothetical protein [Candidatus Peribacteraceae bacterium]